MTYYLTLSAEHIEHTIALIKPDRLLCIADKEATHACPELLTPLFAKINKEDIYTHSGGENIKTLSHVETICEWLAQRGATRKSLLFIVGGGAVLDLGGFVAAVYKRGVPVVYIPTTLLSMVDAAFGGKTAVNMGSIKNSIGVFKEADQVFIDTAFIHTLSDAEKISGFCEVIKYGLLECESFYYDTLSFDPLAKNSSYNDLVRKSIETKMKYVADDLCDLGKRQFLNLGHTVGHAFEGYSRKMANKQRRALLHGEAVCFGLIVELYISHLFLGFPLRHIKSLVQFAKDNIPAYPFDCTEYQFLLKLMYQDKKNRSNHIAIIGLREIGEPKKIEVSDELIKGGLDFFRETFGH